MTEQETKKEIRVYAIDIDSISKELDGKRMKDITKEEFMAESEKQGLVYTLEKFEQAFNQEEVSTNYMFIRIYEVQENQT